MKIAIFTYLLLEICLFLIFINYIGSLFVLFITFGTIFIGVLLLRNYWKSRSKSINKHFHSFSKLNFDSFSDDLFLLLIAIFLIAPGFLTDCVALFLVNKRSRNLVKHIIMNKLLFKVYKKRFNSEQNDTINTTYEEIKD